MKIEDAKAELSLLIKKVEKRERRLDRVNEKAKNQDSWDEWITTQGYLSGLRHALQFLDKLDSLK
jgi:hypothetical protein